MKAGLITKPPVRRDYGDTSSQSQNRLSCVSTVSKGVVSETTLLSLLPNRLSMWGMRLALIPCTLEDIELSLGLA